MPLRHPKDKIEFIIQLWTFWIYVSSDIIISLNNELQKDLINMAYILKFDVHNYFKEFMSKSM